MDSQNIKSILQDALEKEIPPAQIELWPAVKQSLVARKHPLLLQGKPMNAPQIHRMPRIVLVSLIAIALLAMVFVAPSVRTLAQSIMQFFTRADADVLPPQTTSEVPPEARRVLSVTEAEGQAGFDILTPASLPEGFRFLGASYTPETQAVVQQFGPAPDEIRLSIAQQPFTCREDCDLCGVVGASAPVEAVQIGSVSGEYVEGVWVLTENGSVWQNDPYLKTLRWQSEGMAFELIFMGDDLAKNDLIAIAESLEP